MANKKHSKGSKIGRHRKSDKNNRYINQERRRRNKEKRIERDMLRAKALPCGHGTRYLSKYDGRCKRCYSESSNKYSYEKERSLGNL